VGGWPDGQTVLKARILYISITQDGMDTKGGHLVTILAVMAGGSCMLGAGQLSFLV
jgi:hypothetical protein